MRRAIACALAVVAVLMPTAAAAPAPSLDALPPAVSLKAPAQDVHLSADGAEFIASFEGVYLYCYRDPVGIWTIGIGHVGCSPGQRITLERAHELLRQDAELAASAIRLGVSVPLNQSQKDALISFAFNVGNGGFLDSTLRRKLNAGDYQGAADEFRRWVYAGGRVLPGLVRRRAAERELFLSGVRELRKLTAAQTRLVRRAERERDLDDLRAAIADLAAQVERTVATKRKRPEQRDTYSKRLHILRREKGQARDRVKRILDRREAAGAGVVGVLQAKRVYSSTPANGRLPKSALSPIYTGSGLRVYLANSAAAAWNSLALEAATRRDLATPDVNGPRSAYRTYDEQVQLRREWCAQGKCQNAAVPGTSNHGLGLAADVPTGTQSLIAAIGRPYGWDKACSDAPWEAWHRKWCGGYTRPDPGTDRRYPILRRGSGGPGQAPHVREVQRRLNKHGASLEVDGAYGRSTKRQVKRFQSHHDLDRSGVVKRETWRALAARPDRKGNS